LDLNSIIKKMTDGNSSQINIWIWENCHIPAGRRGLELLQEGNL
jgi:hypothetical protein